MKYEITNRNNRDLSPFNIFEEAFNDWFRPAYQHAGSVMKTDIKETEKGYELEVEMPGFDKKDISVSLEDGYLTVSAEKQEKEESGEKKNYIHRERSFSAKRSFYVGDVEEETVKAKYENGVLTLIVSKPDETKKLAKGIAIE